MTTRSAIQDQVLPGKISWETFQEEYLSREERVQPSTRVSRKYMFNMKFLPILLCLTLCFACRDKRSIHHYGTFMYFTNVNHVLYFIPFATETEYDFYKNLSNAKKGYQFYSFTPSLEDSIQHNVKFRQPILGGRLDKYFYKGSLPKDSIFFCPAIVSFDYELNKTYKPQKTNFKQGEINLNFMCYYLEEINFKSYHMPDNLKK
jgi:hypothetical protein